MKPIAALFLALVWCACAVARQNGATAGNRPATSQARQATQKSADSTAAPTISVDPVKEAAIRRLFDVVGTKDLVNQTVASMADKIKPLLESSLPPGAYRAELIQLFFQKFQSKFRAEQLLTLSISVYDKHFSLEEIEGLTRFYETPLGKKAVSVLPQVLSECQAVGSKLGEELGRQSMIEVLAERPDLKKAIEDAAGSKNP